jgi:hypothetical protein
LTARRAPYQNCNILGRRFPLMTKQLDHDEIIRRISRDLADG